MNVRLIGCASTMNEVRWMGAEDHMDCEFLDYSYHADPKKLHVKLQELIDQSQAYDLIILTYGRCSNAILGLISPKVPLWFPNTHDCIGLMLGSNQRHMEMFKNQPETYYFSQGWLDHGRDPYAEYLEYVDRYGEDSAQKLIKVLYGRYKKAVLIITPGMKDINYYREKLQTIAEFFGWEVSEIQGDMGLLHSVVEGKQNPGVILVEAGQEVTEKLWQENTQ